MVSEIGNCKCVNNYELEAKWGGIHKIKIFVTIQKASVEIFVFFLITLLPKKVSYREKN